MSYTPPDQDITFDLERQVTQALEELSTKLDNRICDCLTWTLEHKEQCKKLRKRVRKVLNLFKEEFV